MPQIRNIKIWVRLVLTIWIVVVLAWGAVLRWASHVQRSTAIEQARDFAVSLHQVTLAGLTGMMITGTIAQRAVFLDQIKQANHVRSLKVVRSEEVVRQFGLGAIGERPADPLEFEALLKGQPVFELRGSGAAETLVAVMPAIAQRNYLGKDCLACHQVKEGAVLGAVTMEIALDRVNSEVRLFTRDVVLAALALGVPLILIIYYSATRFVSRPLNEMTDGLNRLAEGAIDLTRRLPVYGRDEIAQASAAFNRVLEKSYLLIESERLAAEVFSHSLEGIMVCDRMGRIQKVNAAFTRTTGYSEAEVLGRTPSILKSGRQNEEFYREMWQALLTRGEWQGDVWNRRKNGEIYPEWLNISAVRNRQGEIEYFIALFSDITERKRQEELIQYQAYHDALTGLPNRSLFKDRLDQALAAARRYSAQVAVMFLDLDRFKQINDTLGHDMGDELLKEVAQRLRRCVREVDTVARMGGDEFTVLLPQIADDGSARVVAEKILAGMRQPVRLGEKDLVVSCSIGIAIYPEHGPDAATLMRHADIAMYHVKARGRAGFALYRPDMGTGENNNHGAA